MGRSDDMLIIKGVNVFPSQIETVLMEQGYPANYQIIVDRVNHSDTLDVQVEMTPELFTDNVEYIKRGALGKYANTYLRMSNNLYNDGTDDYEMIRTKKAIAFAGQIDKVKTARKEKGFADIIKGLHVYGAKLVRPKELYVIKAH